MRLLARLGSLWRGIVHRSRMDDELDEELGGYFEELVARHERAGLSPEDSRQAARREMGGVHEVKSAVRESWVVTFWEAPLLDVGQAWRGLRQTPGLSLVAIATFALGIGAVTAVLGVVDATLFTPPPYRDPSRLVLVWADPTATSRARIPLAGPELYDLRTRTSSFEGFGAIWANSIVLTDHGDPEFVRIGFVTSDFFSLLGVEPAAGRLFAAADEVEGAPESILLSWPLWQRRFGGDPAIVGRTVGVHDRPVRVLGVLPSSFRLRLPAGAGIPDSIEAYQLFGEDLSRAPRGQQFLRVVGRMKPGVRLEAARQDVSRVAADISREFPEYRAQACVFNTVNLEADASREVRAPLWIVTAGVVLLLVVSAVNVLGVLAARAAARRREIALRVALGAGLTRILRLSLAEGLTLAAVGAALGIGVGRVLLSGLLALQPAALRRLADASIDAHVLLVASGLALVWGGLFALAPLGTYLQADVRGLLGSARSGGQGLRQHARSTFVVAQVALTAVLLVSAGLLARTFSRIQAIDPGFRAEGVLTFRVPAATAHYPPPAARDALGRRMRAELGALPSVTAVGAVSHLPYDSIPNWGGPYALVERPAEALPMADYRSVSPGFFEAAGLTLLSGRAFADSDDAAAPPVTIVDEMLASRTWPGESPLGKRLRVDPGSSGTPDRWVTVVGVVRHVRHRSLIEPLNVQVYFPLSQAFRNPVAYAVRTTGDPAQLAPAVRDAVKAIDPALPIFEVQPLAAYLERAREVQRFTMILVAVFAGVSIVLASVGVYGVIAYVVVQRRREYGVRMALGATHGQVVALVLREGARLTAFGAALGLAASLGAGQLIRSQLVGVTPADGVTYSLALPVLALSALLACWWPARRAVTADVTDILRAE
jgi:putative ABC transport system permease protein